MGRKGGVGVISRLHYPCTYYDSIIFFSTIALKYYGIIESQDSTIQYKSIIV